MRANITNMGPDVINSVELFYKVDDFTSSSAVISGLNLASGKTMEIYHPDLFEFDTPGEYNIRIEVSKVNESVDAFVENNVDAKVIEVLDGFLNKPLFEFVVTSTFDMSYTNNYFEALRTLYPGYTTMLKYPIENDPYMTDEALARATDYYGSVYAYATLIINGEKYTSTSEISDGVFNSFYIGKVTPLKIDLETEVIGDSIFINANVFSREYLADGHKLHLAVAENTTYNNAVGTSGEDEFHAILMRMFPGAEGTEIGSLGANQEFQVSYAASLEGTNIEEYTDLSLVAFVQNDLSMKVLQSGSLALNFKAVAPNLLFNIENDATDIAIDTSIIIKSDMALRQLNDEQIDKIEDFILFKKGNAEGENVSFKAEISDDFKEITIKPSIALNYQTNYYVALSNLENKFDIAIENAFVNFKTTTEPSGIEELESEFSIYPNPASDYVVIKGERINELNIYSTTGQLMLNKAGQMSGQIELQLNDLEKGLYFISIKTDKGTVNQTLVIR